MKRNLTLLLLTAGLLLTQGCQQPYFDQLEELAVRTEALSGLCEQLNRDVVSLQLLVSSLDNKDMITGVTELKDGNVVKGYKINFVKSPSITISNGSNGLTPLIGSKKDYNDGNYYWTIQYGSGSVDWIYDDNGNRILSVSAIPFIAIRDGKWCYTFDNKKWVEIGSAKAEDGDSMFKSIDCYAADYVTITMTDGTVYKFPKYAAFRTLQQAVDTVNANVRALTGLISAAVDKLVWIDEVKAVLNGKDTVGTAVKLSNGKKFTIYNWTGSLAPAIYSKKAEDGNLYWAVKFGDLPEQWILTSNGEKIAATAKDVVTPIAGITVDPDDGNYYWTVSYGDSTVLLRELVDGYFQPHARDSVRNSAFSSVRSYTDSLVVVLKDGVTKFLMPMKYSVVLTDASGKEIQGTLPMIQSAGGATAAVSYRAYGPSPSVVVLAQGGFSATASGTGNEGKILITAPPVFNNNQGKVEALFTFSDGSSATATIKEINITKGK